MRRAFAAAVIAAVLLLARAFATQNAQAVTPSWQVRTEPATLVNGAPAILVVTPAIKVEALSGSWMGRKLFFSFDPPSQSWYALFGVGLNSAPGPYRLVLEGSMATGRAVSFEQNLDVANETYPAVELKVAHQFTAPSRRLLKRIKKEEILKHRVFAESSEKQLWV